MGRKITAPSRPPHPPRTPVRRSHPSGILIPNGKPISSHRRRRSDAWRVTCDTTPPLVRMSPVVLLFILRVILAVLLYGFLAALFWMLWQDVRAAARETTARTRRLGQLVVLDPSLPSLAAGTAFPLLPVTSLGRAPTNTAPLPDDTASLEHALLHLRDGQWWLEDLDSRNGTRLNSQPITQPTPVVPGDVIGVGRVKLKIELE